MKMLKLGAAPDRGWIFPSHLHLRRNRRNDPRHARPGNCHLLPARGRHLLRDALLDSDEMFHFYLGDPVEMLQLLPRWTLGRLHPRPGSARRPRTSRFWSSRRRLAGHAPHRRPAKSHCWAAPSSQVSTTPTITMPPSPNSPPNGPNKAKESRPSLGVKSVVDLSGLC